MTELGMYVCIDCRGSALRRSIGIRPSEQAEYMEGKLFIVKITDLKQDCIVLTDGNKKILLPAKKVPLSPDYVTLKTGKTKATRNFIFNKRLLDPWVIKEPPEVLRKQGSGVYFS